MWQITVSLLLWIERIKAVTCVPEPGHGEGTAAHTNQSEVLVPAAHRQKRQHQRSVSPIDINQVLPINPTGCELLWAIFSYLGVLLEVHTSSQAHSNPQLGCTGGLRESVQRCLWVSCIFVTLLLFLKLDPLSKHFYMESSNAFHLKFCLRNFHDLNSPTWSGRTHMTPWL